MDTLKKITIYWVCYYIYHNQLDIPSNKTFPRELIDEIELGNICEQCDEYYEIDPDIRDIDNGLCETCGKKHRCWQCGSELTTMNTYNTYDNECNACCMGDMIFGGGIKYCYNPEIDHYEDDDPNSKEIDYPEDPDCISHIKIF